MNDPLNLSQILLLTPLPKALPWFLCLWVKDEVIRITSDALHDYCLVISLTPVLTSFPPLLSLSIPGTMVSLLFLKLARLTLSSGPMDRLCPLSGNNLLPYICAPSPFFFFFFRSLQCYCFSDVFPWSTFLSNPQCFLYSFSVLFSP